MYSLRSTRVPYTNYGTGGPLNCPRRVVHECMYVHMCISMYVCMYAFTVCSLYDMCVCHLLQYISSTVSIQLAMTISTMESFTRTPTAQSSSPTSPSNISASLAAIATDISPPPPTKSTSPVSQTMPPQSTDTGMSPANTERRKTWSGNGKNSELTMSTVDDYIIVDLPSPATKDDTSSRVPSSEFFPVSQVILNPDDLSMCVVNIGLCVMLYSFQPAQTGAAIKVSVYICHTLYIHNPTHINGSPRLCTYTNM